jgi:hypothetical protein
MLWLSILVHRPLTGQPMDQRFFPLPSRELQALEYLRKLWSDMRNHAENQSETEVVAGPRVIVNCLPAHRTPPGCSRMSSESASMDPASTSFLSHVGQSSQAALPYRGLKKGSHDAGGKSKRRRRGLHG